MRQADAERLTNAGSRNSGGAIHRVDFRPCVRVDWRHLGRFEPPVTWASSHLLVDAGSQVYERRPRSRPQRQRQPADTRELLDTLSAEPGAQGPASLTLLNRS